MRHVEPQRRVDVAVREEHRLGGDRVGAAEHDLGEAQAVLGGHGRGRLARPHPVGQADRWRARARRWRDVERRRRSARACCARACRSRPSAARAAADPRGRRACRRAARARAARTAGPGRRRRSCGRRRSRATRAGLRARSENSDGARAACARRKPGSKRTVSPSTVWPASRNSASASAWSNCTPTSAARRSTPRRSSPSASSDSGSNLGMRLTNMPGQLLSQIRPRAQDGTARMKMQLGLQNERANHPSSTGASVYRVLTESTRHPADPFAPLTEDERALLRPAPLPERVEPMKAVLTDERFSDPAWIFERKLDGIRCIAIKAERRGAPAVAQRPQPQRALPRGRGGARRRPRRGLRARRRGRRVRRRADELRAACSSAASGTSRSSSTSSTCSTSRGTTPPRCRCARARRLLRDALSASTARCG